MAGTIDIPFAVVEHLVDPSLFCRVQTTIRTHLVLNHAYLLLLIFQTAIFPRTYYSVQ